MVTLSFGSWYSYAVFGWARPECYGLLSGMEHWKRLIKISCVTDYYYCINNITCLIHVYYYSVVPVIIPDILSFIMSHVYLVTVSDTYYTS